MAYRRVVLAAYPGAQALDIAGPVEVFSTATQLLDTAGEGYRIEFVSAHGPQVATCSGMVIGTAPLESAAGPIDTLVVPGGAGLYDALADRALVSWIGGAAGRSRRITSVCGGAYLLAEAGLLDGRRATTHWAYCEDFARRYPRVSVDPEPIFVWDWPLVTSAGVSTGIDMSLALVEADHGAAFALEVARFLVLFFKRPGGQSQFSGLLDAQFASDRPIREVQEWILDSLDGDLSVPRLADRAAMSLRNFSRVFRREVGMTPAQYVEQMRISRARRLLEATELPLKDVARRCGFTTVETFFRSFGRSLEVTPAEYRNRFQATAPAGLVVGAGSLPGEGPSGMGAG